MSGGSFNYACFKVEDEGIFRALPDVHMIENYLRGLGKHDAADEVLRFLNEAETHQRRLAGIGQRIAPLLKAAEWTTSSDAGPDSIDHAYFQLMGIDKPLKSAIPLKIGWGKHILKIDYEEPVRNKTYQLVVSIDDQYTLRSMQQIMPNEFAGLTFRQAAVLDATDFPVIGVQWEGSFLKKEVDLSRLLEMIDEVETGKGSQS